MSLKIFDVEMDPMIEERLLRSIFSNSGLLSHWIRDRCIDLHENVIVLAFKIF